MHKTAFSYNPDIKNKICNLATKPKKKLRQKLLNLSAKKITWQPSSYN